jgi:lipoyl(octanoyl) transferase
MHVEVYERLSYQEALALQITEKANVLAGTSTGKVFILQHFPPVVSIGRNAKDSNIIVPEDYIRKKGYDIVRTNRGGDVTIHEPGQMIVYFVMPLKRKSVKDFVSYAISTVSTFLKESYGINALYRDGQPGLWVNESKICALGFDLTKRVSMHGLALNLCNSMEGFSFINPCGIKCCPVTSVEKILGRKVDFNKSLQDFSGFLSQSNFY